MPRRHGGVSRRRLPLVTLTSDVGAEYAAQMRAVLLATVPPERVVELTHELRPHGILEAAFLLRAMASGFPAGTIHLVVVDPGVGGRRVPLVVECRDGSLLVGPDNGVLMPLAEELGLARAFRIERSRSWLPTRVGTTFDGRDLFAPVAARLARGLAPERAGAPTVPVPFAMPSPERRSGGARGAILHSDHFGNLITNVPTAWIPAGTVGLRLRFGRSSRRLPWVTSYEAGGADRLVALGSSFGTVELAVAEGSAARRLRLAVGVGVELAWRAG